jgi:hypothetical protein
MPQLIHDRVLRLSLNSILLLFVLSLISTRSFAQSSEDSTNAPSSLQKFMNQTHVGGYGEMTYENPNYGDVPRLNLPRVVIYLDHDFSDKWVFKSELEMEDVKLERGEGGEIEYEQAYLDYHPNANFGWHTGLMLIPIGIVNQIHEPTTYYSVERPEFDQQVIPTEWYEIGTGVYGVVIPGIEYQLMVSEGLKGEGLTMSTTDGAKQEGSAGAQTSDNVAGSDASHPAISGKLDFIPCAGLRIGAALYYEPNAFDTLPTGTKGTFFMAVLDARYEHGPLHIRGEAGHFDVAPGGSGYYMTPSAATGGYAEIAYNVLSFFPKCESELLPFVRYENFTFTGPDMGTDAAAASGPTVLHTTVTAGMAYKPLDNIIFKADYRMTQIQGSPDYKQFSLGGGYEF